MQRKIALSHTRLWAHRSTLLIEKQSESVTICRSDLIVCWRLDPCHVRCLTYQRQWIQVKSADFRQIYRTIVCQNVDSTWMVKKKTPRDLPIIRHCMRYISKYRCLVGWNVYTYSVNSKQSCWTLLIVWDDKLRHQNSTRDHTGSPHRHEARRASRITSARATWVLFWWRGFHINSLTPMNF